MSDDKEDDGCGAPWLAPESERLERPSCAKIFDGDARINASPPSPSPSSSSRPVTQLLGGLTLSDDKGRSISFADGMASLAAAAAADSRSEASEASPARSLSASSTSSPRQPQQHQQQQQSWPGFADIHGSPAFSAGDNNWVEAIDRAIAEMVS